MIVYIYTLSDPRTNAIRYVGKTVNISKRMQRHKRDAMSEGGTKYHRNAWLRSLYSIGLEPIVQIIDQTTDDWMSLERFHIRDHLDRGCDLTNIADGGQGYAQCGSDHWNFGKKLSAETKQKISVKASERWKSGIYDFHKQPLDKKRTSEAACKQRERWAQYNANKVVSETTRKKLSEVQSRPIVLVDDNNIVCFRFNNAREAAEALGC